MLLTYLSWDVCNLIRFFLDFFFQLSDFYSRNWKLGFRILWLFFLQTDVGSILFSHWRSFDWKITSRNHRTHPHALPTHCLFRPCALEITALAVMSRLHTLLVLATRQPSQVQSRRPPCVLAWGCIGRGLMSSPGW